MIKTVFLIVVCVCVCVCDMNAVRLSHVEP